MTPLWYMVVKTKSFEANWMTSAGTHTSLKVTSHNFLDLDVIDALTATSAATSVSIWT